MLIFALPFSFASFVPLLLILPPFADVDYALIHMLRRRRLIISPFSAFR